MNRTIKQTLLALLLLVATLSAAAYCAPFLLPPKAVRAVCSTAELKAYNESIDKKVNAAWVKPAEPSSRTEVHFTVNRDGTISEIHVCMSSGVPAADDAAIAAVSKAAPFGPVPNGAPDTYGFDFDTTLPFPDYLEDIETLTRTINSNPLAARAHRLRGEARVGLKQYTEALADYDRCIQLAPGDANARRDRALCYEQLSQHQKALDDWNAALKLEPADQRLKFSIARALWKLNRKREAFAMIDKDSLNDVEITESYKLRAAFYLEDNKPDKAVQELTLAIRESPEEVELYELRADARRYLADASNGIVEDLTTAISLNPEDPQLYLKRAKALRTKPNDKRIQQDCSKALVLDPTLVEAYLVRARDLDKLGYLEEAAKDLTLAISGYSTWAYLFSERGKVYARMGLYDKAMVDYEQAYELDPETAGLGDCTIIRGRNSQPVVKYAYINKCGQEVSKHYDDAGNYSEGLAPVAVGGRYGFIDRHGETVIKATFRSVGEFHEGLATAEKADFEYGFINTKGKFVIAPSTRIESENRFSEGLVPVHIGGRTGYLDRSGKVAIKPLFDEAGNFSQGLACASIGKKYGFINKNGTFVIKPAFELAGSFSTEGLAPIVVPVQGCHLRKATEKSTVPTIMRGCHISYVDKTGKIVATVKPSSEGPKMESLLQSWGECFDLGGHAIVETTYNLQQFDFSTFSEGLAAVPIADKFGFVDKSGNFVIPAQFDTVGKFSHGLAAVRKGEKSGFVDKTGKFVIEPKYLHCADFSEGLAAVALSPPGGIAEIRRRLNAPRQ